MPLVEPPPVVQVFVETSEIRKFAMVFIQDFSVLFPDFDSAAAAVVAGLDKKERSELLTSLKEMLSQTPDAEELKAKWRSLGAQWIPVEIGLRQSLSRTVLMLEDDS